MPTNEPKPPASETPEWETTLHDCGNPRCYTRRRKGQPEYYHRDMLTSAPPAPEPAGTTVARCSHGYVGGCAECQLVHARERIEELTREGKTFRQACDDFKAAWKREEGWHQEAESALATARGLLYDAWAVIANAGGGDWTTETPDWNTAAVAWREKWHATFPPHAPERPAEPPKGATVQEALDTLFGAGGWNLREVLPVPTCKPTPPEGEARHEFVQHWGGSGCPLDKWGPVDCGVCHRCGKPASDPVHLGRICDECGSGLDAQGHIAPYPCSKRAPIHQGAEPPTEEPHACGKVVASRKGHPPICGFVDGNLLCNLAPGHDGKHSPICAYCSPPAEGPGEAKGRWCERPGSNYVVCECGCHGLPAPAPAAPGRETK